MKVVKIIKNTLLDFPGKLSCIVFLQGCNWDCWYCQNKSLLSEKPDLTQEFFDFLKLRQGWLDGVVVCGGEPTIHPHLPEFSKKIKDLGFAVKLDTNGTNPDMLQSLIDQNLIDYVAMDIKAPLSRLPKMVNSTHKIENLEKSIKILLKNQVDYEFRSTITPELTLEDVQNMAQSIAGAKRYYLQQYHKPDGLISAPEPLELAILDKMCEISNKFVKTCVR